MSKILLNHNTANTEKKWHTKLNTNFSVHFWNCVFYLPQKMLVNNKIIWTQIQINKHLLPTNYTVSQYDKNVSPLCSLCKSHNEELHNLLWGCKVVGQFWQMVGNTIENYFPKFILGRKEALFGDIITSGESPINTLLILSRFFIWQQKFTTKQLDVS